MRYFHRRSAAPDLRKTILKTHRVQLLKILLTNKYFIFDNKLYYQTIGVSIGAITWNFWHTALSNPGTAVRKLTTQEQNQHSCPFQRWWAYGMGEGICTWRSRLLPNCKQLPQSPEIHTHDLTRTNHIPGHLSVQWQKVQRPKRTGYQKMHQTNWDIPVSQSNILPPQLAFLGFMKGTV